MGALFRPELIRENTERAGRNGNVNAYRGKTGYNTGDRIFSAMAISVTNSNLKNGFDVFDCCFHVDSLA